MRAGSSGPRARNGGFAYLLLLVLIAALAVAAVGSVRVGHNITRRHAEEALLAIGDDFRNALLSYRSGSPQGPSELADLLRDPRAAGVRRHLRRVPADPLTGGAEWGLVRDNTGRILAVYSLAPGRPIKRVGFAPTQIGFENAEAYAQWRFGYALLPPANAAAAPR